MTWGVQCRRTLLAMLIGAALLVAGWELIYAQDEPSPARGATVTGRAEPNDGAVYRVRNLPAGAQLYAYATTASGSLDPLIYLLPADADPAAIATEIRTAVTAAGSKGEDPFQALTETAERLTLAWDDDSGAGYAATFAVEIPATGDYWVGVMPAPASASFGDFSLRLGVNSPEVGQGQLPQARGLEVELVEPSRVSATQEITGTLTVTEPVQRLALVDMDEGDTFVAAAQTISGTLVPALVLEDFGGKPLAAGNLSGDQADAEIEYTFTEDSLNYTLSILAVAPDGQPTAGEYRLRLARNVAGAAEDVTGTFGPPLLKGPSPVAVALMIEQFTNVDQEAENFTIVANFQIDWHDPALAFSPDSCRCSQKVLRSDRVITDFLTNNNINVWPATTIFNQQGGRSAQNQLLIVQPDGSATYFERFTATLQAPDFNFRRFPFDTQQFYVRVQSLFEDDIYLFQPDAARSGFGEQLGEEEWIFSNDEFTTDVITVDERTQAVFAFTTHRHLSYYTFRIGLPIFLIILVSWFTFFLRDYGRRIEVTSGNLLLFIAYNFTIAGDLPRLGYLTFLDVVLISTFVISTLVIIINVWFRRMEAEGRGATVEAMDKVLIWFYPLLYLVGGLIVYLWYFRPWIG